MAEWFGINYPFRGGVQNVLSRQIGTRIIKNDILQLFYTNPGERVYRPDYGIGIRLYLFDQLDDTSISDLNDRIYDQIAIHEPRVTLDSLQINSNSDTSTLDVRADFSLVQQPDEEFVITLSLPLLET
jgi:phage baseplate assembly protein W